MTTQLATDHLESATKFTERSYHQPRIPISYGSERPLEG